MASVAAPHPKEEEESDLECPYIRRTDTFIARSCQILQFEYHEAGCKWYGRHYPNVAEPTPDES